MSKILQSLIHTLIRKFQGKRALLALGRRADGNAKKNNEKTYRTKIHFNLLSIQRVNVWLNNFGFFSKDVLKN
ncbi:hypothetical protein HK24_10285 [Gluconobacter sp. DsW_058]|nr:hypothetical protein HK24_10285 [Gluconobacter sp. DsW_058]